MIPLILQDSIDRELLQAFIDMRAEKKKPISQRGLEMLIKKLSRLERDGHCPNLLLERSLINGDRGWQDVYPDATTLKAQSFMEKYTDRSWRQDMADRSWADPPTDHRH